MATFDKFGRLKYTECFRSTNKSGSPLRIQSLTDKIEEYLYNNSLFDKNSIVIIEGVELWSGSAKSQSAGTTGKLSQLAYMIGSYIQLFLDFNVLPTNILIINPSTWKGQVSDELLRERVEKKLSIREKNPHIISAIGLGLWYLKK